MTKKELQETVIKLLAVNKKQMEFIESQQNDLQELSQICEELKGSLLNNLVNPEYLDEQYFIQ